MMLLEVDEDGSFVGDAGLRGEKATFLLSLPYGDELLLRDLGGENMRLRWGFHNGEPLMPNDNDNKQTNK